MLGDVPPPMRQYYSRNKIAQDVCRKIYIVPDKAYTYEYIYT